MTSRDGRLLSAAMLGVASGAILVPLNSTMLAVALPGVMDDFGLGANSVSSLVTLYLGAVAVALPIGGSIGDRYGHRPAFLLGVLAFALASALAAVAGSFEVLEIGRIGQAVAGAFISTSSAALIRESAPAARQGEAFGLFDLLVSTSAAVGPFIGGLLVGGFGWRSLFVLAVPIGVVSAAFVGLALRPETPDHVAASRRAANPIDLPGLGLLALVIVAFVAAVRAGADGGLLGVVAALAVVPLLGLFVAVELRRDRPAVDPRLFLRRPFAAAVAGVFGGTVILHGTFVLVPFLVEDLLHETALTSGIVLLGLAGVGAIVAPFGGRFSDRNGRPVVVVAGSTVSAIGLIALWIGTRPRRRCRSRPCWASSASGTACTSPRQAAALEIVEPSRVGMAAGTYYTGRYLGGVVGASLAGAILGQQVTIDGVAIGFGVLAATGVGVALVSLGLSGAKRAASGAGRA